MRYEFIAAPFLLTLTSLLWTGVLCAEGLVKSECSLLQILQETPLNAETVALPKESSRWSPWLGLSDDLLTYICQFYGPVQFNTLDRRKIVQVLAVLITFDRLFKNLMYVGTIKADEVLAYYPFLSELSFVKKRYPEELEMMLTKWPLPKGNFGLSLFISAGPIREFTLNWLAFYLPYISDKSARLAAVNYCLDACAEGSIPDSNSHLQILRSTPELCVLRKLKRILIPSEMFIVVIAGSLLHFVPAELDEELVDDLDKGLAEVAAAPFQSVFCMFCINFIGYPTTLWDSDLMLAIFERNVQAFQAIPFTAEQRVTLCVLNKIKFGAPQDIRDMSEAEREALFGMFHDVDNLALVFHIWAREDAEKDDAWAQLANDLSNTSALSELAFDPDGFFQKHFCAEMFEKLSFNRFLEEFRYHPNSRKKQRFHELLRTEVQERPKTILALLSNRRNYNYLYFNCLVWFFICQDDKAALKALSDLVSQEIDGTPSTLLAESKSSITDICQRLGRGVNGPLRHLAERLGAAAVLRELDFSRLRANEMGETLEALGISPEEMDAVLSSLGHKTAPKDELTVVLRGFHSRDRDSLRHPLRMHHSLWFYLWKEHREAFLKHIHRKIKRHYQPILQLAHARLL